MDVDTDLASEKERVESINHSNNFLKLMDESVDLMRKYHPQGERYYWVLYYSYMSAYKAENVEEILDKLEPHCPQLTRVHRTTISGGGIRHSRQLEVYFWGCEGECEKMMKQFSEEFQEV